MAIEIHPIDIVERRYGHVSVEARLHRDRHFNDLDVKMDSAHALLSISAPFHLPAPHAGDRVLLCCARLVDNDDEIFVIIRATGTQMFEEIFVYQLQLLDHERRPLAVVGSDELECDGGRLNTKGFKSVAQLFGPDGDFFIRLTITQREQLQTQAIGSLESDATVRKLTLRVQQLEEENRKLRDGSASIRIKCGTDIIVANKQALVEKCPKMFHCNRLTVGHDGREVDDCDIELVDIGCDVLTCFLAALEEDKFDVQDEEWAEQLMLIGTRFEVDSAIDAARDFSLKQWRQTMRE